MPAVYVGSMAKAPKLKKRAPKKLRPINVRMDDEMLEELRIHAEANARPVSNFIFWIVKQWLDENRGKISDED